MQKGDIVYYRNIKAKIIGESIKSNKLKYKLHLYDGFHTIIYNVDPREVITVNSWNR